MVKLKKKMKEGLQGQASGTSPLFTQPPMPHPIPKPRIPTLVVDTQVYSQARSRGSSLGLPTSTHSDQQIFLHPLRGRLLRVTSVDLGQHGGKFLRSIKITFGINLR
ncbi:Uncharacterized protein TCM_033555 [Theobroma cacao]|uniref:Uncharacterized protein n=1 Tax=Theobroma cacao TaxID=3641 RepID=A0A061FC23_THECC|nr:Uncharacterized protein TCM_033555 [Theobroma cacao]